MSRPVTLRLVLGDQLWHDNPALEGIERGRDLVVMIEAPGEATLVWNHRARIALFLSAMRHFRDELLEAGYPLHYVPLDAAAPPALDARLSGLLKAHGAQRLVACEPGEWRLRERIAAVCSHAGVALEWRSDTHFIVTSDAFARWAQGRRQLRMEHFYRAQRRQHQVLLDEAGEPVGGRWNYDAENRKPIPPAGPPGLPHIVAAAPDRTTREVFALVQREFAGHPGSLEDFHWPLTRRQALHALDRFVAYGLVDFGPHQDAMWSGAPWLWHSLLSTSLNLHLLDPREVIAAAQDAWREGRAPLASVEGFVRQVLGWREFIRGVYWLGMPGLREANHYAHQRPLPRWYWTGETHMACMREVIGGVLRHGYAHHIQRLMVTGQFGLLAQLSPQAVEDWYLAMFVDAVEWVELPNTAGMALHADGGGFTSKPYVASGQYVKRMSNYCRGCRYRPEQRTGPRACPMTTLYWGFLDREEGRLAANPRTVLMARSVSRLDAESRAAIRHSASRTLDSLDTV